MAEPGVDFANSVRWSIEYAGADQANFWGVAMWMGRLLNTYDYLRNDVSAAERAMLDTRFHNAADFYRRSVNNSLSSIERFPNRVAGDYQNDPPAADGCKVIVSDTDHLWGVGGDRTWVWKSFTRGHHPIYMDPLRKQDWFSISEAQMEGARKAMGDTRRYAERINLVAMSPHGELSSTRPKGKVARQAASRPPPVCDSSKRSLSQTQFCGSRGRDRPIDRSLFLSGKTDHENARTDNRVFSDSA